MSDHRGKKSATALKSLPLWLETRLRCPIYNGKDQSIWSCCLTTRRLAEQKITCRVQLLQLMCLFMCFSNIFKGAYQDLKKEGVWGFGQDFSCTFKAI